MAKKFDTTQKSLISVYIFRIILELFTTTFLTSYILTLSPDTVLGSGILNIGIFYISMYATYALLYFTISFFVDKSNRVSFLRIGILVTTLLLIALIFYGELISHWIVLAGALCGISDAFFYSSYLVMRNELNSRKSLKKYNLLAYVFTNVVKIIVPIILGYLLDITSFAHMSIYFLLLAVIQFGLTCLIKSNKPKDAKFEIKKFLKYLKRNPEVRSKIKYTYLNAFTAGFKSTYKVIVTILTIYTFKTNFSLGIFTSIFSLTTMLLLMIYKKFDHNPKLNKFATYLILGIVPFILCIVLVIDLNVVTLVIYNLFLTIAIGFSDYFGTVERDAIIKNVGKYEYIAEHQFCIELIMCSTRILSYGIFILIGLLSNIIAFKILLVVLLLINPIKFMIMYKQRLIRKEFEDKQKAEALNNIPAELPVNPEPASTEL